MIQQQASRGKRMVRFIALVGCAGVIGVAAAVAFSTWQDRMSWRKQIASTREMEALSQVSGSLSAENFKPIEVVSRPPLVTGFKILSPADADAQISPDETVLGVAINGEARAYPLNVMTGPDREVFNDTLGEREIAATW